MSVSILMLSAESYAPQKSLVMFDAHFLLVKKV